MTANDSPTPAAQTAAWAASEAPVHQKTPGSRHRRLKGIDTSAVPALPTHGWKVLSLVRRADGRMDTDVTVTRLDVCRAFVPPWPRASCPVGGRPKRDALRRRHVAGTDAMMPTPTVKMSSRSLRARCFFSGLCGFFFFLNQRFP